MQENNRHKGGGSRAQFATRLGVIAATVGSAVGLGNIWRFPYEAGMHGGGAFLIVYLGCILLIGIPVITAEFIVGRSTGSNIYGAFRKIHGSPLWRLVAMMGIVASLMILSFYSVVAGWTASYVVHSVGGFAGSETQLHEEFASFTASWQPVGWTVGFLALNYVIMRRGVEKGIEHVSNVLTPLLFVLLVAFCANSMMMPEAREGLLFLFRPDFSAITPSVLIGAMGQAFFSLSLGLGCLLTYASYFRPETRLLRSASTIAGLDTLVAVMAGIVIFPAVFTFGASPESGPRLVFEVLPAIFSHLAWGNVWATLFFLLLLVASLTSTILMSEISIAFFTEECHMRRSAATILTTAIAMVAGTACALSFGPLADATICGRTIFGMFDYVSSNILLPVGGMMVSILVGWVMKRAVVRNELALDGRRGRLAVASLIFCLRYIAPSAILLIFLSGL